MGPHCCLLLCQNLHELVLLLHEQHAQLLHGVWGWARRVHDERWAPVGQQDDRQLMPLP